MRSSFFALCVTAALLAAPLRASCFDGDPPPPPPPPPAVEFKTASIPWVDGWDAGRVKLVETGKLAFVFVRGTAPPCEPSKRMEDGPLSDPLAAKIAERAVPVRIDVGHAPSQSVRDFMTRYGVQAVPAFLVLDAAGHMACNSMKETAEGFLSAIDRAQAAEQDFEEARAKTDPENRAWFRELLKTRLAWDELIPLQKADVEAAPTPAAYAELARLQQRACRRDEERATLAKACELFPKDALRTRWRMRIATQQCDLLATDEEQLATTIELLEPLASALAAEKDPVGEAEARIVIAHSLAKQRRFDEAVRAYDHVIELNPVGKTAPAALLGEAAIAWAKIDYPACKALCERVRDEYPKSDEAKAAWQTIKQCELRMK
jgi:hypothetical protein